MTASTQRRVLLLINPDSGQGNAALDDFKIALRARSFDIVERLLDDPERNFEHVRDAADFRALIVAGGDGTVSSIAYEAREQQVPLLIFPAGTANLIAQNLGLPGDPLGLVDVLEQGHVLLTDLAQLEANGLRWGFTLIAGAGVDARMIRDSENLKPRLGVLAYVVSALRQAVPEQITFHLDLDGQPREVHGISVMFANFGMANLRLPVAADIDPTDGRLTVVVLKAHRVLDLLPDLIDRVRERLHLGDPLFEGHVETFECREATLRADRELPVQYDGEVLDAGLPLSVKILPGAARFLTPQPPEAIKT